MPASLHLRVPPRPCVVKNGVFDAWSWCESDTLEWRRPNSPSRAWPLSYEPLESRNPPDLVFVFREHAAKDSTLPRELASLHAIGFDLTDELALAPYGIDDATDGLFASRARPTDVFWLAADSLPALVWGLHDWAHFHHHGPFEEPAWTELQCDLLALEWLRINQGLLELSDDVIERVAQDLGQLSVTRFSQEGVTHDPVSVRELFLHPYPLSPVSLTSATNGSLTEASEQPQERKP